MLDHRKEKFWGARTGARRRRSPIGVSGLLLAAAVVTGALLGLAGPGGGYTSIAEAEHALPAPETLTAVAGPTAGSATLNWTAVDGATRYRVHWISSADLRANLADDAWVDLLGTADLGDTDQHTVTGLNPSAEYFFIVGVWQADDSIAWSEWDRLTLDSVEDHRRAVTRAYVQQAIDYYEEHGREAAVEFYRTPASAENGRTLILIDTTEYTLLVYRNIPALQGQDVGPGSRYSAFFQLAESATEEGAWATTQGINPVTKQEEPRRVLAVLHDGLVFSASHSALVDDVAASVQEYVSKATARYDQDGLDAVIAHYNSEDSLEGQFYLFLIGADDIYLAHPIFPHLIGTDIKDVVGSDGQELGKEIALATEDGIWVEYLWPHPVSRTEQQKVTWAIRHDGLIFASGYYAGAPEAGDPAWQDADPREYTVQYVRQAVERYEREGLDSFLNYYNSVASFEGQWYLFATDANDIYHVHPLIPTLIGTDIKDVVGSDGYELGNELAKAVDGGEGVWVEYLWPHPVTLKEVPKVGYAVRRDGLLFASGYYPQVEDPAARTKEYVQQAIDHYQAEGLDETVTHYNSQESLDGQWSLTLADENDIVRVAILAPQLIGTDLKDVGVGRLRQIGQEMAAATEEGRWVSFIFPNTRSSETLYAHVWAIRYDGLLFTSRYYDDQPDVPAAKSDDELTREYVEEGIAYYNANGQEATVAHYNSPERAGGIRGLMILQAGDQTVLASTIALLVGSSTFTAPGTPIGDHIAQVTAQGTWYEHLSIDPATGREEPRRSYGRIHDGLIFVSSHTIIREDLEGFTKRYVQEAIDYYEENGKDATVAYYDSKDSVEGQFYLFLIGADDTYLAHPILPRLKGTDIKDVQDTTGYELGKEIAKATTEGHWVDYQWPHPVTLVAESKSAWVVRHDGLIFGSGYYTPDPNREPPAWQDADPREYTITYVDNAIERYRTYGEQGLKDYYNSVGSFEGQWYLFVTDANANDTYIVHGLFNNLLGRDIKTVSSSDNPDLGKQIAAATEEGVWVEYLWPHPLTLQEAPKVAYAKRYDGLVFSSGYYPEVTADPAARTKQHVADAIAYYDEHGLDATAAHYNSPASIVDGQLYLTLLDGNLDFLVHPVLPNLIGVNVSVLAAQIPDYPGNDALAKIPEEGQWLYATVPNPLTAEEELINLWAVRHDGLFFMAGYTTPKPVPTEESAD